MDKHEAETFIKGINDWAKQQEKKDQALKIVEFLAALPNPIDSFYDICGLCQSGANWEQMEPMRVKEHRANCPWRLAKELVDGT